MTSKFPNPALRIINDNIPQKLKEIFFEKALNVMFYIKFYLITEIFFKCQSFITTTTEKYSIKH
jgi:hypothetical protein